MGMTDWHSHLLPAVDDGVESLEESLEILDLYEKAGIAEVWLTPHIMEDVPNIPAMLCQAFDGLRKAYNGSITLHLAAENMLDGLFAERFDAGALLPIGKDAKTLLVETSYFNPPVRLGETLNKIKSAGYFPLLAHPERYNYIEDLSSYRRLKEQGVMFQLNLLSVLGYYGPVVQDKAETMLGKGMYDRVGTDLHRRAQFDILTTAKVSRKVHFQLSELMQNQ